MGLLQTDTLCERLLGSPSLKIIKLPLTSSSFSQK